MGKEITETFRERALEVFLLLQYDARIWQKLKERKWASRMNYSKKHLKHIWYEYCFNGADFKALGGLFSHDRMALTQWNHQRVSSLYRKCRRKDKSDEGK